MTVNPISPNTGQPQQIGAASGKDPEQAFGELTKSKSQADEAKNSKRAIARRAGKIDNLRKTVGLDFDMDEDDERNRGRYEYRTVLVDGQTIILRLICVA
ncbi:MAG: hypothetical protein HYR97_06115 [Candidatus Melainabacteria bacterium]|nr:hypothetical protein [Candidatus Melainabacteria bacterium]MBI3309667.1 hypothetical protein [Candidatus Melainabacteria bacterium]